jgi:hypothetical protein
MQFYFCNTVLGNLAQILNWPSLVNIKVHNLVASCASTKAHPSPPPQGRRCSSIIGRHLDKGRAAVQGCKYNQCKGRLRDALYQRACVVGVGSWEQHMEQLAIGLRVSLKNSVHAREKTAYIFCCLHYNLK